MPAAVKPTSLPKATPKRSCLPICARLSNLTCTPRTHSSYSWMSSTLPSHENSSGGAESPEKKDRRSRQARKAIRALARVPEQEEPIIGTCQKPDHKFLGDEMKWGDIEEMRRPPLPSVHQCISG
jgi:hypothetical protein